MGLRRVAQILSFSPCRPFRLNKGLNPFCRLISLRSFLVPPLSVVVSRFFDGWSVCSWFVACVSTRLGILWPSFWAACRGRYLGVGEHFGWIFGWFVVVSFDCSFSASFDYFWPLPIDSVRVCKVHGYSGLSTEHNRERCHLCSAMLACVVCESLNV